MWADDEHVAECVNLDGCDGVQVCDFLFNVQSLSCSRMPTIFPSACAWCPVLSRSRRRRGDPAGGEGLAAEATPWFGAYRREYLRLLQFGEHETLDHPVACERVGGWGKRVCVEGTV